MPVEMSHKTFEIKELVDKYFPTSSPNFLGQGSGLGSRYNFYFLKKNNYVGTYWEVILSIETIDNVLDVRGYMLEIDGIMSANGKVAIGPISKSIRLHSKEEIIDFCLKNLGIIAEAEKMEKAHKIKTAAKEYF